MRRFGPLLVAWLLAVGCQAAPAGRSAAPPAAAAQADGAGTGTETLSLVELRATPALSARILRPARVYTGRGPFYLLVAELPAGAVLPVPSSREGWLLVQTPDGRRGWLPGADASLLPADGAGVAYRLQPGRWELEAEGVLVEVLRLAPGVVRVAVSGLAGTPRVAAGPGAVAVLAPVPGAPRGALPVGDGGIAGVSVGGAGVLVDLEGYAPPQAWGFGTPVHRVTALGPGRAELEFRPQLALVAAAADGWRLEIQGDLRPLLRAEGGELVLELPGARLAPGLAWPPGIRGGWVDPEPAPPGAGGAAPRPGAGATTAISTRMPAGGVRLRLPSTPGQPYALYRPRPGELALRLLPPGLAGKTVVLDPGHGGEEAGAGGPAGQQEKDVNLAVARRLATLLEQAGARVVFTRSADARVLPPEQAGALATLNERTRADLEARVALANGAGADLFLSIHANGGPPGEAGTETYWAVPNLNAARSRRLAELVQAEVVQALGRWDRGVKQRPFHVIRYTDAPAALVELAFLSDYAEAALLSSPAGQAEAAGALFRAVAAFFSPP